MIKTRLDELGVAYEVRDMMTDRDYFVQHQIRSVPVLITSEAEKIFGPNEILAYFQKNT